MGKDNNILGSAILETVLDEQKRYKQLIASLKKDLVDVMKQNKEFADKIKEHDKLLERRMYLTPTEKKALKNKAKEKIQCIIKEYSWPYDRSSRLLSFAIWKELKQKYNVGTFDELPSKHFGDMAAYIDSWYVPAQVMKKIEERLESEGKINVAG